MHVFIDSNVCYTDPYMQKVIYNRLLIELSQRGHINLYVSEVVRQEVINNFRRELKKYCDPIKKNEEKIKKLIREDDEAPFDWKYDIESYVENFESYLGELEEEGIINIVPIPNNILPELIERSIKRIKPFTEKKQEFRDATIWLSYVHYVLEHKIEHAYFITNNTNDFMLDGSLHPDMKEDCDVFTLFNSAKEFIDCEEVKEIEPVLELKRWVDEQDFSNNSEVIHTLIERQSFQYLYDYCSSYVLDNSDSIPHKYDTYDSEWLELYGIDIKNVTDIEVQTVLENIIITGYMTVEAFFEVNDRNPLYEPGEEEYFHMGSDECNLIIRFSLELSQEMEVVDLDIEDIEVDEVLKVLYKFRDNF